MDEYNFNFMEHVGCIVHVDGKFKFYRLLCSRLLIKQGWIIYLDANSL